MTFLRSQRGQATIDYVALLALLALLLGASAAVASDGANGVTNAVLGQLRRALCIVTGGSCPAQRLAPCVVASDRKAVRVAVSVAIFRVDKDRVVLRERLSDGTVRLTVMRHSGVGVEVGAGGRARVRLKGRTIGFDREARAGGVGVLGLGRVYVAADDREADEMLRQILRPRLPIAGGGPRPRQIFVEGGVRALGRLGISEAEVTAGLQGMAEGVLGARRDQRSGEVTISLGANGSAWALLRVVAGGSGSSDRTAGLSLPLDRRRRPVSLSLTASGTFAGGQALAPMLASALGNGAGQATAAGMKGRHWELSASVDLRDPDVAAAWAAFRRQPANPAAIRALGAQLRTNATLDVRTYAQRVDVEGVAGAIAAGVRFGGELDRTHSRSRLLTAATRPAGGLWERRLDCV